MNHLIALAGIFFGFVAIIVLVPIWLRHRSRAQAIRAISEAIEKGRETAAALIERLVLPRAHLAGARERPVGLWFALAMLVLGVSALCVGAGLTLAARFVDPAIAPGMVGACVNLGSGIAYTTLGLFSLRFLSGRTRPAPRWDYASILALITLFLGASGAGVSAGLGFAARVFAAPAFGDQAAAGMLIGAFINACTGIGFTMLGIFILRVFATYGKHEA